MELNKIYNTDCLDFMKNMPDACVDLVVTDPPYIINTKGGGLGKRPIYEKGDLAKIADGFDVKTTLNDWFYLKDAERKRLLEVYKKLKDKQ